MDTCPNNCDEGVIACWSPGGPCAEPNRPGCETCGACQHCTASGPIAPSTATDQPVD